MYVLQDLWWGNIAPCDKSVENGSPYARLRDKMNGKIDAFCNELSDKERAAYEALYVEEAELATMADCDTFVRGFRLGARMMLDVMGEYDSPLERKEMRW